MLATLYLPATAPRPLTAAELTALNVHFGTNEHLTVTDGAAAVRQLLDTNFSHEVLASGPTYLVLVVENAADLDLPANLGASVEVARLTGFDVEDEPLVGPLLIIEA